jgi:hypothetical protein
MIFNPDFRLFRWLLPLIGCAAIGIGGMCFVALQGSPGLAVERSVVIEAGRDEIWSILTSPTQILRDFPLGDDLWLPRKPIVTACQKMTTWTYLVRFDADIGNVELSCHFFPQQNEVWFITRSVTEKHLPEDTWWYRRFRLIPVDTSCCRLVLSSWKDTPTLLGRLEKFFLVESRLNLLYEDFLYFFKERLELKRRSPNAVAGVETSP